MFAPLLLYLISHLIMLRKAVTSVSYYVNVDWQFEKRTLSPRLIDVSHNGDNIVELVCLWF